MKLKEAIEMVSEACYHYDGELYENCNYSEAFDTVLEELNNRIPIDRINEQIRFLNDEGYFEFNTKRDLEKATEILNNLLNKE